MLKLDLAGTTFEYFMPMVGESSLNGLRMINTASVGFERLLSQDLVLGFHRGF